MSALRGETPENSLPCSSLFITSIIRQLAVYSRTEQHLEDVSGISNTENDEENALGNPLSRLPADALAKVKPLLLTLHCLFPNELLLALDILDRNLVIKYTVRSRTFRDERKHHIPQEEEHYGEEHYEDDGSGDVEVYCGDDPRQQHYMSNDDDYDDGGCHDNGIYFVRSLTSKAATLNTRRAGPGDEIRPFPHGENEYQVCLDAWNCTCPAFTLATFRDLSQGMNEPQLQAQGRESGITLKQKNWVFGGCLTQNSREFAGKLAM
ncbi:hypothetical protein FQN49_002373 [Arthroderma sp. PD_2]|nr:hypothetical protein FQN49_002373 [Arthroderma sp. PD_2]